MVLVFAPHLQNSTQPPGRWVPEPHGSVLGRGGQVPSLVVVQHAAHFSLMTAQRPFVLVAEGIEVEPLEAA